MAEADERIKGTWEGREVSIKRKTPFGHTLTDGEADALFDGQHVRFPAVSKSSGNQYVAQVVLAEKEFTDKETGEPVHYVGLDMDFDWTGPCYCEDVKECVPDSWSGHTFSEAEKETLVNGGTITARFTWKSGKSSEADVKFDGQRIVPLFD